MIRSDFELFGFIQMLSLCFLIAMQLEGRNNEEIGDWVVYFSIIIVVYFSITIYSILLNL